jgi:hypothetical protein
VRELTVGVCDRHIQTVVEKNGPGLARTLRAVLSGICKHAAKHDALERNPVRDVGKVTQPKAKKNVEALTFEEAVDLRTKYRQDPQAVTRDLPTSSTSCSLPACASVRRALWSGTTSTWTRAP